MPSMEGGEMTLRHRQKEKHLEGELSTKCRDGRNSEKDEWKPFHVAPETLDEAVIQMKYGVSQRVTGYGVN